MGLTFQIDDDNNFVVIETSHTFIKTYRKQVKYSPDITKIQLNNDPWRETTTSAKEWFEKYYRKYFDAI